MKHTIDDLIDYLKALRDEHKGCGWTREQTFESLLPFTLEEVYETIDSIEKKDYKAVKSELGDLLYHIVFYCQLASEKGYFNFNDVVLDVLDKHQSRNPANGENLSAEEVNQHWDAFKLKQELEKNKGDSLLSSIPLNFPALIRAVKLQRKAALVGFDWDKTEKVLEKLEEEILELKTAMKKPEVKQVELTEELGDILFTVANLARHLQVEPEIALRGTNEKFQKRFNYIEQQLKAANKTLQEASLEEMERLWVEAKTYL